MSADLHDPATDERLEACPECHTLGTVEGYECGVCLGDGWVWKEPSAIPAHVTKYVDHSGIHHSCGRRSPPVRGAEPLFAPTPAVAPYGEIHRERMRAHTKHDARDGSMERKAWDHHVWLPVLTEEVGEVARVLCENELGIEKAARERLREELVQVAAMACAWIDALDTERP